MPARGSRTRRATRSRAHTWRCASWSPSRCTASRHLSCSRSSAASGQRSSTRRCPMADFELISVTKHGSVLECWLNRPDQRNAISTAVEEEWDDVLALAQDDDDIKVVTLQGRGPVFSAGADMKEYAPTFEERQKKAPTPDGVVLTRPARRAGAAPRPWPPPAIREPQLPTSWYFRN